MAKVITIVDIEDFTEMQIYTRQEDDATKVFASVSVREVDAGGNVLIVSSHEVEITGAQLTALRNFTDNLKTDVLAERGISP